MEVWRGIVCDENIDQAIFIEVARHDAETVEPVRVAHARLFRNVSERAVAVVAKERVARAF